jgi:hypothetical protein
LTTLETDLDCFFLSKKEEEHNRSVKNLIKSEFFLAFFHLFS